MSTVDEKRVTGGFVSLEGGMDSGRPPALLKPNQCALAVNVSFRGGYPHPRNKFKKLLSGGSFIGGRFQHADVFELPAPQLMCVIAGRFFAIDASTLTITEVTPTTGANPVDTQYHWSITAENFWIYQDSKYTPLIYDGSKARRSDENADEVPTGSVMGYISGRLVVALPDRRTYRVGDLVYNTTSGTQAYNYRDSVLKFTETKFLNEGGDLVIRNFSSPADSGPITAIKSTVDLNTSLGQGPGMVYTTNMVFSINLPFDRTTWKDMTNPLQTVAMIGAGATGDDTTVHAHGDIYYRSLDGWRTMILAYRNFGDAAGNVPMSTEMDVVLQNDALDLLRHGSGVYFDNRLISTVSPVWSDYGVYHRGLASMDFDLISSLREKLAPVWEGVWMMPSGMRILKVLNTMVNDIDRCFVFALNTSNQVELWEMLPEASTIISDEDDTPVTWTIDLRSDNFGSPFDAKKLEGGDLFLDRVQGTVVINVEYKEDHYPCWRPWWIAGVCATVADCTLADCVAPRTFQPQSRKMLKLPTPPDGTDTSNNSDARVGYEFQVRLLMQGECEIISFRAHGYEVEEFPYYESRPDLEVACAVLVCPTCQLGPLGS